MLSSLITCSSSRWWKKADFARGLEGELRESRDKNLKFLEAHFTPRQARLSLAALADLLLRCALAKPWPKDHGIDEVLQKIPIGKY